MAKKTNTVAVQPLPPVDIVRIDDPGDMLHVNPLNARFVLPDVDLSGTDAEGNAVKYHWRLPVKDSDLIHVHKAADGKLYALDGNRRVSTLRRLRETDPTAYRRMLEALDKESGGAGFRIAVYRGQLTEAQILWALRDVDKTQLEWTPAEKFAHYLRLRRSGATQQQAAAFFGMQRAGDFDRLEKLSPELATLWVDTRKDAQLAADAAARKEPYTRTYSALVTQQDLAELSKAVSDFREQNPGSTAYGPEYEAKLAAITERVKTPSDGTAAYRPPVIPTTHREMLGKHIATLISKGEILAADALATGIGLALDTDDAGKVSEKITRTMRADDIARFVAKVESL